MAKAKAEKTEKVTKKATSKKGKDVEKSFELEQAIVNILKELEKVNKRLAKIEKKLEEIDDNVIDTYNEVLEISEGLDLEESEDYDDEDDEDDEDDDE